MAILLGFPGCGLPVAHRTLSLVDVLSWSIESNSISASSCVLLPELQVYWLLIGINCGWISLSCLHSSFWPVVATVMVSASCMKKLLRWEMFTTVACRYKEKHLKCSEKLYQFNESSSSELYFRVDGLTSHGESISVSTAPFGIFLLF